MNAKSTGAASEVSTEKLMQEFRVLMADAEALLRATAGQAGDKVAATRERIQENLAAAKASLNEAETELIEKSKYAAEATDTYVHDNPWKAIGVAVSVGVIVGMLIGRGR